MKNDLLKSAAAGLAIISIALLLISFTCRQKADSRSSGSVLPTTDQGLKLMGNRFLTLCTVVRVNQIEVSRDRVEGEDESAVHSPDEARTFREAVEKGWPVAGRYAISQDMPWTPGKKPSPSSGPDSSFRR
jgi:hypothetical protein